MNHAETIKNNIQSRKRAESAFELIRGEADQGDPVIFFRTLAMLAASQVGHTICPLNDSSPMGDQEAAKFSKTIWPWGEHKGEPVVDLPPGFVLWCTESPMAIAMRRYASSDFFQRLQEET